MTQAAEWKRWIDVVLERSAEDGGEDPDLRAPSPGAAGEAGGPAGDPHTAVLGRTLKCPPAAAASRQQPGLAFSNPPSTPKKTRHTDGGTPSRQPPTEEQHTDERSTEDDLEGDDEATRRIRAICGQFSSLHADDPVERWVAGALREMERDLRKGNVARSINALPRMLKHILRWGKSDAGIRQLKAHYKAKEKMLTALDDATRPIQDAFFDDWDAFKATGIGAWLIDTCGVEPPAPHIRKVLYRTPTLKDENGVKRQYTINKNFILFAVLLRMTWQADPAMGRDHDLLRSLLNGFLTTGEIPRSGNDQWAEESRLKRLNQYTDEDLTGKSLTAVEQGTYVGEAPPGQPYPFLNDFMVRCIYKNGCYDLVQEGLKEKLPHYREAKAPYARTFGVEQGKIRPIVYHKFLNFWTTSTERMRLLGTDAIIEAIAMAMAPPGQEDAAVRAGIPQQKKHINAQIAEETQRRKDALAEGRDIADMAGALFDPRVWGCDIPQPDADALEAARDSEAKRRRLDDERIRAATRDMNETRQRWAAGTATNSTPQTSSPTHTPAATGAETAIELLRSTQRLWHALDTSARRQPPPWICLRDMSQAFFQLPVRDPDMNVESWFRPANFDDVKDDPQDIPQPGDPELGKKRNAKGKRPGEAELWRSFVAGMGNVHSIFAWVRFSEAVMAITNTLLHVPMIAYVDDNIIIGTRQLAAAQLALFDLFLDRVGIFRENTKSNQHSDVVNALTALGMDYTHVVVPPPTAEASPEPGTTPDQATSAPVDSRHTGDPPTGTPATGTGASGARDADLGERSGPAHAAGPTTTATATGTKEMMVAPSAKRIQKAITRIADLTAALQAAKPTREGLQSRSWKVGVQAVGSLTDITAGHREEFIFSLHRSIYVNYTASETLWDAQTSTAKGRAVLCQWLGRALRNTIAQGPKLLDFRVRDIAWVYTDASFPDKGQGEVPYIGGVLVRPGQPVQAFSIPMGNANAWPWKRVTTTAGPVPPAGQSGRDPRTELEKLWDSYGIFELEACAVYVALDLWGSNLRGTRTIFRIDNIGVVASRTAGRSTNKTATLLLDRIRRLANHHNIKMWATYVLSELNIADLFTPKDGKHRRARAVAAAFLGVPEEDPRDAEAVTRMYKAIRTTDKVLTGSASTTGLTAAFEAQRKEWARTALPELAGGGQLEVDYDMEVINTEDPNSFLLPLTKDVRIAEREERERRKAEEEADARAHGRDPQTDAPQRRTKPTRAVPAADDEALNPALEQAMARGDIRAVISWLQTGP